VKRLNYDIIVIGGGPAGLAAALEARRSGAERVLICERGSRLGGILEQCIHNGFGLSYFKEELTGPEYAQRFVKLVTETDIDVKLDTMVIDLPEKGQVIATNGRDGLFAAAAKAVILAMGCRERTREAITITGDRPSGIMTAGAAQRYTKIEGYLPGREVVILGSGDIGLIMARRLTLEGVNVKCVLEIMPYSTGLIRNKVQCLDDFGIPLYLGHTVTRISGRQRLEGVSIAKIDSTTKAPIAETETYVPCDTLLLSIGLIPENELSKKAGVALDPVTKGPVVDEKRRTSVEWIFACGNVLHVHDLVDNVSEEAETAGRSAAEYIAGKYSMRPAPIRVIPGDNIGYIVPQSIDFEDQGQKALKIFMRVKNPDENIDLIVRNSGGKTLARFPRDIVEPGSMQSISLPVKFFSDGPEFLTVSSMRREA
jgi:NADPH-dependent 2,4-dienoyl-CoA reductase/sulfur reductase-like enzyme